MEAIIVASGIGKRLGAMGKKIPKCMLHLKKNLKIIDKIINELSSIKRINIVIGHKGIQLKKYLEKNKKIRFIFNKDYQKKGNFYSVLLCKKKIKSSLILLDADIILPKNSLVRFLKDKKKNLIMVNPKNQYDNDDILLQTDKQKVINKISIKTKIENSKTKYSCAGVIKMSKHLSIKFFNELSKLDKLKKKNFYYEDTYEELFKKHAFSIFQLKKIRLEIDKLKDYKKVKRILNIKNEYI